MLTITIFATIVSDMLPVSNNTPLIGGIAKNNNKNNNNTPQPFSFSDLFFI